MFEKEGGNIISCYFISIQCVLHQKYGPLSSLCDHHDRFHVLDSRLVTHSRESRSIFPSHSQDSLSCKGEGGAREEKNFQHLGGWRMNVVYLKSARRRVGRNMLSLTRPREPTQRLDAWFGLGGFFKKL